MKADARCRLLLATQPLEAGVPRHVHDLIRFLDRDAYAVTVACPAESELWHWLADLPHVTRHAIAPHREPSPWDVASLRRLAGLIRSADVVHAHSSKVGFLARLAAAGLGGARRCIFTPHGWSFWSAEGPRARFYTSLERASARWCRTILTVSDHERRAGLAQGVGHPAQYRVVRNGVDPARFAGDVSPHPRRVLFVGRLAPPKRPDLVVRAIDRVRRTWPDVELHIVGDGPDRARLEALVDELGVRQHVKLLGKRDDVPALLARASCMAFASDYEGCPLTVLEAKAAGVPVAATAVGGVPEIVQHDVDGLLVAPGSVDEMVAAISRLVADPAMAIAMGAAGRRSVREHHTSAGMAAAIAALYQETIMVKRSSTPDGATPMGAS